MLLLTNFTAALKFFRNLVGLKDEFYNHQMMQEHLFEPILNVVYETMPRDNLLNSACLELFHQIQHEDNKPLINHLVENYRDKIKHINYIETFSLLILKYDQMQKGPSNPNASFLMEEGTPGRPQVSGGRRWQGVKDLDPSEEEYFNTSDDEDESPAKLPLTRGHVNGASPLSKALVDYASDEEGDMMDTDLSAGILPSKGERKDTIKGKEGAASPIPWSPRAPRERLSEKRRREEDEEDELGKLAHLQQPKRRNSTSSVSSSSASSNASNASNVSSNVIRRKRGFANARDSTVTTPRKIAISLSYPSPTIKSGGEPNKGSSAEDAT